MNPLGPFAMGRFRAALRPTKTATCAVRTAASGFAAPGTSVACHYGETAPARGERLDFEAGNGRGYTVWLLDDVAVAESDLIVITASPVAADVGKEIQVTRVPPRGNLSSGPLLEGTLR